VGEQVRGGVGVVQGRVRAVVGQARGAAAVEQAASGAGQEMRRELHRAQAELRVHRYGVPELAERGGQEQRVEGEVVRDQRASPQQGGDLAGELGEGRRPVGLGRGDAVDVLRAEVAVRVDQAAPLALDPAAFVEVHHGELDDPVVPGRAQSGGLHIDDRIHDAPTRC
jgi:hypothetical protein